MQLQCAVPTSEKFTLQLSALHFRPDGWLLANISGGRGQFPATPIGVERLNPCFIWCWDIDRRLFHFVTIHASDRQTELQQQYLALHYVQSHGKNDLQMALFNESITRCRGSLHRVDGCGLYAQMISRTVLSRPLKNLPIINWSHRSHWPHLFTV